MIRFTEAEIKAKGARNRAAHQKRIKGGIVAVVADLKAPVNKFGAVKTVIDGITFASKHEAKCYSELKLLEKEGVITNLALQVSFDLCVNGMHVCKYVADFSYRINGNLFVADAKGYRTPVYRLKKKLMLAVYGIEVLEL